MSSKSVAEKVYIKAGMTVGFFNAPDNLMELLGGLPDGIKIAEALEGVDLDFVLAFINDQKMLEAYLGSLRDAITDDGALWLAYIKGSSSMDTDINRESIHELAAAHNLKGVAMVSINEDWSGFRFKKV